MHEFGAYAPNITGSAFLLELWNNAPCCSLRTVWSKKSGYGSDSPKFVVITHNDTLKNQVDNAIKAADVFASPVQGEGDRRRRWKGCWKMKSLLSNPEFVTIFLSHHT